MLCADASATVNVSAPTTTRPEQRIMHYFGQENRNGRQPKLYLLRRARKNMRKVAGGVSAIGGRLPPVHPTAAQKKAPGKALSQGGAGQFAFPGAIGRSALSAGEAGRPAVASALVYPKPAAYLRVGSRELRGPQQPTLPDCQSQDRLTPIATGRLIWQCATHWRCQQRE